MATVQLFVLPNSFIHSPLTNDYSKCAVKHLCRYFTVIVFMLVLFLGFVLASINTFFENEYLPQYDIITYIS